MAAINPVDSILEVEQRLFEGKWEEDENYETVRLDGCKRLYHQRGYLEYQNLIKFVRLWNSTPPTQRDRGTCTRAAWVIDSRFKTITLFFSGWSIVVHNLNDASSISDAGSDAESGRELVQRVHERLRLISCLTCQEPNIVSLMGESRGIGCKQCSAVWCKICDGKFTQQKCPQCQVDL